MVALARVTKPVGLSGGVRVQLLCDNPERLREVQQIYRGKEPRNATPVVLQEVSDRTNGVVVFFEDCTTRSAAEGLRDHFLFIPEELSIPSPDDQPRVHELIGCDVKTAEGNILGTVSNVYDLPVYRVIGVTKHRGGVEVLVPFVDAWVVEFDKERRCVMLKSDELFDEA